MPSRESRAAAPPLPSSRRLRFRRCSPDDAPFLRELVNDADFVRHIGDRNVQTDEDAKGLVGRFAAMEAEHGFTLFALESRDDGTPLGLCGLLKRPWLDDVDVGYALLPAARGRGLAREAARAAIEWGRERFGLERIVAIVSPENDRSVRLLEALGLRRDGIVLHPEGEAESLLFVPVDVRLREVRDDDLPVLYRHQCDAEAVRVAAFTAEDPTDREAFDAHWERIRASPTVDVRTILFGDDVVGHIASFVVEEEREVTYWIDRDFWGRGIATRALRALLADTEERPLFARVAEDNVASARVLEKCGFRFIGRDRGFAAGRGEEIDETILRLDEEA